MASGWCKLTEEANPHSGPARELFELVFADALAFGTLLYKIELAQSRERLDAIEHEGHEATFNALGGAAFLAQLRSVHGALQLIAQKETVIDCHEQLAAAAGALRQYVIRVSSHADREVHGSEELSHALMAPLDRWQKQNPARPPRTPTASSKRRSSKAVYKGASVLAASAASLLTRRRRIRLSATPGRSFRKPAKLSGAAHDLASTR